MNRQVTILIVDDEILNLEILSEYLHDPNYQIVRAENGKQALNLLMADKNRFHAVLLDRMMPNMDGLEVLSNIRRDPQLAMLPVILQSAKAAESDIYDGLDAGANYYLTKPFDNNNLLAIVNNAIDDYLKFLAQKADSTEIPEFQDHEEFVFQTPAEAHELARLVATTCKNGEIIAVGLLRLMMDAIEHGNLEIGFGEKARLMVTGRLCEEIGHRLQDSVFKNRKASLIFDKSPTEYRFQVINQGSGFNLQKYLETNASQSFVTNHRIEPKLRGISFDKLAHAENGKCVTASHCYATDSNH